MQRRSRKGFQRTSSLLRDRIRKAGETRGFAVTRVLTHWAEIVGQDMAAVCKPVDVKYGRQGFGATLTVLTTGAQAPMLEMQKEKLREKVNAAYGYNAITKLHITQTAPIGFAEGQVQFAAAPKAAEKTIDPEAAKEARALAAPVGDQDLRKALERLAGNVLSKEKSKGRSE